MNLHADVDPFAVRTFKIGMIRQNIPPNIKI